MVGCSSGQVVDGGGRGVPAPVLALREDRSRPHAERPRWHPHDSAVSSRRSPGAGRNDPPGAPFPTTRGPSPVIATPRTRTASRYSRSGRPRPVRGPPHAHDVPDADPAGRTTDCGVLHIGGRLPRGPTPSFPHDSAVLPGTSVFSERAPMCRQGLSAHGRISTALNAGEFPHDSADPPPTGSDRMCSTAPTNPIPHIRTRQHRPNTESPTPVRPAAAREDVRNDG